MLRLDGKSALVTGSARGIGAGIAERLAGLGAHVALIDRDEAALADTAGGIAEAGGSASTHVGDVLDKAFLDEVAASVARDHGTVDVLVNNAGIIRDNFVGKISEADWDAVLGVNLKGPFLCCQAVLPHMREQGHGKIVNISSRSWLGNIGQANYSASKGGLVSLTRTLGLELARFGIHVNAVAPGLIDTPMTQGLPEHVRERLIKAQPTRQMGSVRDIASAVAFLASDEANFIVGQVLHVDGGKSAGLLSL